MAITINIPSALRRFSNDEDSLEVTSSNVKEALSTLTTKHESLKKHLFLDDGNLRSFVNIFINDDDIRYMEKLETPVKDGDEINIIPSIAGGC